MGFRGILRDTTEKKKAEIELRKAHDELEIRVTERTVELANAKQALEDTNRQLEAAIERANRMTLEANLSNEAKRKFLTRMSREIRSSSDSLLGIIDAFLKQDSSCNHNDE